KDLVVADGGLQEGVPVNQPLAAINQAFAEEVEKRLPHGARAAFVECKPRALPVAGAAHLLELIDDPLLVNLFPLPDALDKPFTAQIVPRFAFFFAEALL